MLNAETKKELLTIIDEIAGLEKRRNEIRRQEFDLRDRISTIRAKNLVDIAVVKDNKEKPIYPNEQVREAALVVALDKDSELQDISIEHIRLSNRKALLMFEAGLVSPSSSSEIAIE
jgi:hypothetical protein